MVSVVYFQQNLSKKLSALQQVVNISPGKALATSIALTSSLQYSLVMDILI